MVKKSVLLERLSKGDKPMLADGAMGTMLHMRGIALDCCFDALNQDQPALVAQIHHEYITAGAEIITTNTFGANRLKLAHFGMDDQLEKINRAGVELAKRVVQSTYKPVLIAGDVGPLPQPMAPFGRIQPEEAVQIYREQMRALVSAGVDLILIETMTDLQAVKQAIIAANEVAADLPVIASMTFTRDGRTLLGDMPANVAREIAAYGADVIGINCSGGPAQLLNILKQMLQAQPQLNYAVMPNAGFPEQMSGRVMYTASPEYFKDFTLAACRAGARIIGGCCGTTPQHVAMMRKTLDETSFEPFLPATGGDEQSVPEPLSVGREESDLSKKIATKKFVLAVEMDPPRGLSTHKIIAGANLLVDAGADVIHVADSPMARMRMSPWAVSSLIQRQFKLETTLHFPTRGRNLLRVQGDLLAAHAMGIRNLFVVMGDPTAIGDYPTAMDQFDLPPTGLIKLIKQGLNQGLDHAGNEIGQPTAFFVGAALNINPPDLEKEIKLTHKKIDSGADFFLTQPVFDIDVLTRFINAYTQMYGKMAQAILVGLLPLATDRHARFLHNEVPGITIPQEIQARMAGAENMAKEGIKIATELAEMLMPLVQGVYFIPAFNRFDAVAEIIETIRKNER